jgi:uncharacterized membrane protein
MLSVLMPASPSQYVPQFSKSRRPLIAWSIFVIGAVAFLGLIVGAPLALASNHQALAITIYRGFSKVCHQIPERSFYVAGFPLAVCARCTGLYLGFVMALVTYPLVRPFRAIAPHRKWLFMAAVPMAIDVSLTFLGIWENTHSSRFLTGALLGAVAVYYVVPGVTDLALYDWSSTRDVGRALPLVTTTLPANKLAAAPSDYSSPHRRI